MNSVYSVLTFVIRFSVNPSTIGISHIYYLVPPDPFNNTNTFDIMIFTYSYIVQEYLTEKECMIQPNTTFNNS